MDLDEILEKKVCVLCHQFPMGTGVICDNCRNDKGRMMNIMDKKIKRMEAEKIERSFKDYVDGNCIKCHDNPSLETMPLCTDCARQETFSRKRES